MHNLWTIRPSTIYPQGRQKAISHEAHNHLSYPHNISNFRYISIGNFSFYERGSCGKGVDERFVKGLCSFCECVRVTQSTAKGHFMENTQFDLLAMLSPQQEAALRQAQQLLEEAKDEPVQ